MTREERLGHNEALFRAVNERLKELADRSGTVEGGIEFLCECTDELCTERITLGAPAYARVRSDPRRFILVPGHERGDVEWVVARDDGYIVVEKIGEAGEQAEREARR
jgi:hypothetical protein